MKDINAYVGRPDQIYGVKEVRLVGGKGDGMRLYQIRNGSGLEITVSLDRCADLSEVRFKGVNIGYFSPCGYVSPAFYEKEGIGFLKSFTAGFMTTCGLTCVGSPCTDEGENLPLHGTIANTPCEQASWWIADNVIHVKAVVRDASLFSYGLELTREYLIPLFENKITLNDTVKNVGNREVPLQMLYHCNIGYPMLSERSVLSIPSVDVKPRNEHAAEGISDWMKMERPQKGYEEMCYYHKMNGNTTVKVSQPDLKIGLELCYDANNLPCFTEWKMMGEGEYVLGIEPGNTYPDGRDVIRKQGKLEYLQPNNQKINQIQWKFTEE